MTVTSDLPEQHVHFDAGISGGTPVSDKPARHLSHAPEHYLTPDPTSSRAESGHPSSISARLGRPDRDSGPCATLRWLVMKTKKSLHDQNLRSDS